MATVDLKMHLTEVAEAIRVKRGHDNLLSPQNFAEEILEIETGTDTSDATAAADEIFAGKTAYGPDGKVTGTFTIDNELSKQDDLITQIYTALAGKAGGQSGIRIDTGSFVLDTDFSGVGIQKHNLGVAPNFTIVYAEDDSVDYANYTNYVHHQIVFQHYYQTSNIGQKTGIVYTAYGANGTMSVTANPFDTAALTVDRFVIFGVSSTIKFKAGVTYRYVCGVLPGIREVE